MNIYVTGMNPADCNALKRKPRVPIFQAFVEAMHFLRSTGENLTWKRTLVGDRLPRGTDAVIVSVMLPRSLNCPFALGVMWTISEALRRNVPLVIYLTDWAFFATTTEFKSIERAGQDYFYKKIGGALQYAEPEDMIEKHGTSLLKMCGMWGDPSSKLWQRSQIMVPRFTNWGDVAIVQRYLPGANPVITMDPTPLFTQYLDRSPHPLETPRMEDREIRWLLPSLSADDRWLNKQDPTWPVVRYGRKNHDVVQTEWEVQKLYQRSTGALCPPYPTEGSGWWRSRWIHSSRARSVLLCGWADARAAGSGYSRTADDYEDMHYGQLRVAAEEQRVTMDRVLQLDLGLLQEQIREAFRKAGA